MASRNRQKIASRTNWANRGAYVDREPEHRPGNGGPPATATAATATATGMKFHLDAGKNQMTVTPIRSVDGTVTLPGSKSLSNRCLLLAALSSGTTRVNNLLESDDIRYMLGALDALGVDVVRDGPTAAIVTGRNGPIDYPLGGGGGGEKRWNFSSEMPARPCARSRRRYAWGTETSYSTGCPG